MQQYLDLQGISKSYPGVKALDDVSFRVEGGRVLALLGENGAGKSTLLKVLSGDIRPDEGTMTLNGEPLHFASPNHAIHSGISVIYQERQLIGSLSVMENVFIGHLPKKFGIVLKSKLRADTQAIIDKFKLPIFPDTPVMFLSVAYQQMVEIMKAYRRNSKVIAFDEPTAPLTEAEITILFDLIRQLKAEGKIIIYVSHRLKEIFEVTDEIVVLKDGKFVTRLTTAVTDEPTLIKAMVGRDLGETFANLSRNDKFGEVLLEVKNLNTYAVNDITFSLRKGEVVGFAGLVGSGRTEVARAIFGDDPVISGDICIDGQKMVFEHPKDAIEAGIALCPEDRKDQGLVLFRSIEDNICMPVLAKLRKFLFLDVKACEALSIEAVRKYDIKTPTVDKIVIELSGGNQQKVILGRWTSSLMTTKLLILDEPTKGIDVKTKAEIYQRVCDFAKQGYGVIFISSELTEVINIADTIVVMRSGHISGIVNREAATEESVLALAMLE